MNFECPYMALDLEDPWRSSSLDQDGSRNFPNSVSFKQKALKFIRSCLPRSLFRINITSIMVVVGFYLSLLAIGQSWAIWRIHGNHVFYMLVLCSMLFAAVAIFFVMVMFFIASAFEDKVLNGDEKGIEIEAPTWFLRNAGLGCFLFSLLAAIMGWLSNDYVVEKGLSKHLDIVSLESFADAVIPYCFGFVSSIALALVFFFVIVATFGVTISHIAPGQPDPVSVATTSKVKISRVFVTSDGRPVQLSILFS